MGGKSAEQTQITAAPSGFPGQPYSATFPAGQPGQLEALAAQLQKGGYPVTLDALQKLFAPTEVKSFQPMPGMSTPAQIAPPAQTTPPPAEVSGFMYDQPFDSRSYLPNSSRR